MTQTVVSKIAFIGNYPPRQCGIATFTSDLCESIADCSPQLDCFAVPVTDISEGYDYPARVRFEIREEDTASYRRAADFLNISNPDVVSLQHEYGIFGGQDGSHILILLRHLKIPVVTTLHTVLQNPNKQQLRIMNEISELSDALVCMSQKGIQFLKTTYQINPNKLHYIPHGIPDISFIDPNFYKDQLGVEGKTVLLTFGLLSPNKGIEYVIKALPEIVSRFPNLVYIILGATHPNLLRNEGETYRIQLQQLAEELGVGKQVLFYNRFVSIDELKEFIVAADIYITPYLNQEQITSGTLAYTFGAGNAVISTPFWHAHELLQDGRGRLVPFADSAALAKETLFLIENETVRHALRKNAYLAGREMVWSKIAKDYLDLFKNARLKRPERAGSRFSIRPAADQIPELPSLKLDHLFRMTDSTGLIQHAVYTVPNYREGYCTDDNARALILSVLLEEQGLLEEPELMNLQTTYMAFIHYAFLPDRGTFRNFMSYERNWLSETMSEDCHGRALWALGTCIGRARNKDLRTLAGKLFDQAMMTSVEFRSPRAWSFILIGIHEYLRRFDGDRLVHQVRQIFAEKLFSLYLRNASTEWPWFETQATYCNGKLSHALILCGRWLERPDMMEAGLNSLAWLDTIQTSEKNHFHPIGNAGFFAKNQPLAGYDQQPIEAYTMISANLEAYRTTGDPIWYQRARKAFQWFMGRNDLGLPLYDPITGGCRDALHVDRVNQNEGAESSLAFYLALTEMKTAESLIESRTISTAR